jgi:cobalamin 5'-phosphate synthase/cobalamin synthase
VSDLGANLPERRGGSEGRAILAAVTFLTRIPVGGGLVLDAADVARSGPVFPLVGAGVGAAVGGTTALLAHPLSPLLAAGVGLALGALLTGALHLDALADTCDALGGATRERALAIMRDHAVGAYGVVAVVLDLVLKAGALVALARHGDVVRVAVAAGALSRLVPVGLASLLPYARPAGGAGAALTQGSRTRAVVAALVAIAIAAGVAGLDGLVLAAVSVAVAALLAAGFARWLGGVTGDALGAASELTEVVLLIVAVGLVGAG